MMQQTEDSVVLDFTAPPDISPLLLNLFLYFAVRLSLVCPDPLDYCGLGYAAALALHLE
jgi:hypothetical protein